MKPTIHHLSHIDLDGYSCQLVMEYTPYKIYSYNANYGAEVIERLNEILDVLRKSDEPSVVFITDLNLTLDEAKWLNREVERLNDAGKQIEIILRDHHGSGQECANKYEWYFLDTSKCATKLTYEYAKATFELDEPEWMSKFVAVVNAVDLWLQDEVENFEYGKVCMRLVTETRELNRVIFGDEDRKYKVALLKEAAQMVNMANANIILDEKIHALKKDFFRENDDDTLDNLATRFIVKMLGAKTDYMTIYYKGYKGFLSYGVGNTSIIGNGFLVAYPEYDFIVDVSTRGTMSLRANNQVDVSLIAKEWAGGGGHPNASGGRIQGFKEQFRYDKVKLQIENLIHAKEAVAGKLEYKAVG
ncbi:phosphoesterase [Sulfurimonas sp. HSL3-7]|uniref:DHH family phosphoesterase n=1 Tax=Sulfonitrofixus jiaomeiensis TaxID=3131938 RepID=UPI0031F8344B